MSDSSSSEHLRSDNGNENIPIVVDKDPGANAATTTHSLRSEITCLSSSTSGRAKEEDYPSEKCKAFVTFVVFFFAGLLNTLVLANTHDVVSRTALTDLVFVLVPQQNWAQPIGDYLIGFAIFISVTFLFFFHKQRTIVLKRFFYTSSILYLMRAICICLTHYPSSYEDNYERCVAPSYDGFNSVWKRVIQVTVRMGLQVKDDDGRLLCGDLLFSGHTLMVTQSTFYLNHYTPKFLWPLRWILIVLCVSGMICLTISRTHYSVDVVIAYWISSLVFSLYHAFCSIPVADRPQNRAFRRLILFWTMFELEKNVPAGRLPNHLEWPLARPRFIVRFVKQLNAPEDDNVLGRAVLWLNRNRLKTHF